MKFNLDFLLFQPWLPVLENLSGFSMDKSKHTRTRNVTWNLYGNNLDSVWKSCGIYMEVVWNLCGIYVKCTRNIVKAVV
jgi:hypothetical protein